MADPKVSVIVAAYNAADTIGATLTGLLTQNWPNIEVIVVDDGSSDETAAIATAYAERSRPGREVRVESQRNAGQAAARNRAIVLSTGDYLAICDSDDTLLPPYLETAVRMMQAAKGKTFVTSNAFVLTPAGINGSRPLLRDRFPAPGEQRIAAIQNNFVTIFSVFPRAMVDEIGVFDQELRACEDWDLWLRAVHAGWTVLCQSEPHAVYRWTGASVSSGREEVYAAEDAVIAKMLATSASTMNAEEIAAARRRLEYGSPLKLISEAEAALRADDLATAKARLLTAASLVPMQRQLVNKARIARVPGGLQLLRKRQSAIDAMVDFNEGMAR